jgi:hypothetical protein
VSYQLPTGLPHLSTADAEEVSRLLRLVFRDQDESANRWLGERSDYFRDKPIDVLRRDELGVVWVISYLKEAAP